MLEIGGKQRSFNHRMGVERRILTRVEFKPLTSLFRMNQREEILIYGHLQRKRNKINIAAGIWNAPVYSAILFGSYARDSQTDKSDIDIVIDSRGELINIDFYGVLEDITNLLGKCVDLFEITELKNNTAMKSLIEQEGIVLYDRQR